MEREEAGERWEGLCVPCCEKYNLTLTVGAVEGFEEKREGSKPPVCFQ